MSGITIKDYLKQSFEDYTKEEIWELKDIDIDQIFVLTDSIRCVREIAQDMLHAIENPEVKKVFLDQLNAFTSFTNERLLDIYKRREAFKHKIIPALEEPEAVQ